MTVMEDKYRELLADNLTKFRKAANLTQYELAQRLNYSDKAISKWERGEAFPDVFVLYEITNLYGISLDDLFRPNIKFRIKTAKDILRTHNFVAFISFVGVWFIATLVFFILLFTSDIDAKWMSFIYAIPASFIILTIFTAIWGHRILCALTSSVTLWTVALSIYLTMPNELVSKIFILCIPIQIVIITVFSYIILIHKTKKIDIKVKQK